MWTGAKLPTGYGHFRRDKKDEYAHRAAYELRVGPIPAGTQLGHICENKSCCNPNHLMPRPHWNALLAGVFADNVVELYAHRKL